MSEQLFDVDVSPLGTQDRPAGKKPSADRARTERQKLMLARGQHPTGNGEVNRDHHCGECTHCVMNGYKGHHWYKCEVSRLGTSSSAASDIRISWPSCAKFEAKS